MRFYFASDTRNHRYCKTRKEAHDFAKTLARFDAQIEQVEVATDAANLLRLLNEEGGTQVVERTWQLTPRGGLEEVVGGGSKYGQD